VRLVRLGRQTGALSVYGQGFGAIAVLQHRADARAQRPLGNLRLPQVNIGGATGTEVGTPLGTLVSFRRGGVDYVVAGSVPPLAAENAARGLR
jgi:hypothetical protein